MRNKGFVLMETIIVIVVVSVALLTIFSSYNKILRKVKSENKYDTSEYIYMTKYIKENLNTLCNKTITANDITYETITNYYDDSVCPNIKKLDIFGVKRIYVLTKINGLGEYIEKKDGLGNHINIFDAYMIDYLKKLDVDDNDKLIVVEYKRPALKTNGEQKSDTNGKELNETYIASLEW